MTAAMLFFHISMKPDFVDMKSRTPDLPALLLVGDKGLWVSNIFPDDKRLILTESGIDALSFYALHGKPEDRYMSTAGEWSPKNRVSASQECRKIFRG